MKIFVIFTGGTIGSRKNTGGTISPDDKTKYTLLEKYKNTNIKFDTAEPYSILSENLSAAELNMLISRVAENLEKGYDGIVVTHGTDTLAYTAAALGYCFCDAEIPIMLVSSNHPLDDPAANGYANFEAALRFIAVHGKGGVLVPYKNTGEDYVQIYDGVHLAAYPEYSDKLSALPAKSGINIKPRGLGAVRFCAEPRILAAGAHPADSFCYDLKNYRAVILSPYHSGTLDCANSGFENFCADAAAQSIPIFAVNINGDMTYESAKAFDRLGIVRLYNSAFAAAYVKLWLGISLNKPLREFMLTPICGEF